MLGIILTTTIDYVFSILVLLIRCFVLYHLYVIQLCLMVISK